MGRKKELQFRICYDCANAHLMQWADDPVVAECGVNHERQVASTLLPCFNFKNRLGEPIIEKRKKRQGLSDIFI